MLSHNTGALKMLACQASVPPVQTPSDRDAHVRALCDRTRQYLDGTDSVDLIVLPELCTMEYSAGAFSRLDSLAEPIDGPSTRAMENQAYLLSLSRAGADYGGSIFCPPWIDDDQPAQYFETHDEDFKRLELDPTLLVDVRSRYTFLKDRLDVYWL